MNDLIKNTVIWFFVAFLPFVIAINLMGKKKHCHLRWVSSIFIAVVLSVCCARISINGYQRYAIVWFLMGAVFIITVVSSRKTKSLTDAARVAIAAIATITIPFIMTLLNQYWPTFTISHVANMPADVSRKNADNIVSLPKYSVVHIKNQSQSVLTNTKVRYIFVSSKEGGADLNIIDQSFSEESFNFAPQEEKVFLFSFRDIKQYDHLFLIAQVRHRPLLWPFTIYKEWQVFNYSPQDYLWVTMRKDDSKWNKFFQSWYDMIDRGNLKKQNAT